MRLQSRTLRLFLLLLAASWLPALRSLAQAGGSLKVSVVTKRGHPVPRAVLILVSDERVQVATTDRKGEFEFSNLPALKHVLEATYLDFPVGTIKDIDIQDQASKSVTITVDPPGGYFTRGLGSDEPCHLVYTEFLPDGSGRVSYDLRPDLVSVAGTVGTERGANVRYGPGVTVSVLRAGPDEIPVAEIESGDQGVFHFDDLAPGKYRLKVSRPGYYTGTTMDFWVARKNTTRIGPTVMYPEGMTDLCGTVTEIILFNDPVNPYPEPELIDPNRKSSATAK